MRTGAYLVSSLLAGAVLICLTAASPASATVLCGSSCGEPYGAGTKITSSLASGTKTKLKAEVQTVECSKSTISATTENEGGETETVKASVGELTFAECNCEVKVLKNGTLEVHSISGTSNGTVTETGAEVTFSCSTVFGLVHCIYATESTDLGTLTGGNPANLDVNASVPRLTTSFLCPTKATWEGTYEVTSPKPLSVNQNVNTNTVLCSGNPNVVNNILECPKAQLYSGQVTGAAIGGSPIKFIGEKGEITCDILNFEGEYESNGKSLKGKGVTNMAFSSKTGACTSTLPNNPTANVVGEGLPFDESKFTYAQTAIPQGSFEMLKKGAVPELKVELIEGGKVTATCKYTLVTQSINFRNADAKVTVSTFSTTVGWNVKPKEPVACPGTLIGQGTIAAMIKGNTPLYIAKQAG